MATIFDKWNESIDIKRVQEDIKSINKGGEYEDVPVGRYECRIDKMELKECGSEKNAGKPMFSAQFRILQGQYKNSCMFMNQLVDEGWKIGQVLDFLKTLNAGEVEFKDYNQFNGLLMDMMEVIDESYEYLIEFSESKTGFPIYTVKDVYPIG